LRLLLLDVHRNFQDRLLRQLADNDGSSSDVARRLTALKLSNFSWARDCINHIVKAWRLCGLTGAAARKPARLA
jgi:hypothetical protein